MSPYELGSSDGGAGRRASPAYDVSDRTREEESVGKGYAEGPAAEEAERRLEELAAGPAPAAVPQRVAVYGSTVDDPARHFIGWLGEVDPDALFASGAAWGITVVRQRDESH